MERIRVSGVWKQFNRHSTQPRTLKEWLVSLVSARAPQPASDVRSAFWALKDVSFAIRAGEMVGIIGDNGSGKSTVLKLITGISKPTRGSVTVNGRISALLELGAGFHPDFTGRENVFLNASILGLKRKEIEARFDDIVDFAELSDFIDYPVKTYSSGMYMRLAFAIAVNVDPDILVIDEVLAVGDAPFQKKCFEQIKRFRRDGKTILLVTHDPHAVRELCDRAIWIQKGVKMADGPPDHVLELYGKRVSPSEAETASNPRNALRISDIHFVGSHEHAPGVWAADSSYKLDFKLDVDGDAQDLSLAIKIFKADGACCYTSHFPLTDLVRGTNRIEVDIPHLPLLSGTYTLEVCGMAGPLYLEVRKHFFQVHCSIAGEGIAPLNCHWNVIPEASGGPRVIHPL